MDRTYTNGVIAMKEKNLLNEKLFSLCDGTAENAFRYLKDCGFGFSAVEAIYPQDFEKLIQAEQEEIDRFIRIYAPNAALKDYFMSPRDFHNVKALIKERFLGENNEKMFAPDGNYSVAELRKAFEKEDYSSFPKELQNAIHAFVDLEEGTIVSGVEIGSTFEKALQNNLLEDCKRERTLKKLLLKKGDMKNLLTALRSENEDVARQCFIQGNLSDDDIFSLIAKLDNDNFSAEKEIPNAFWKRLKEAKRTERYAEAERFVASYDSYYFSDRRFDLKQNERFIYYVIRARIACENVRILLVCLLAGLGEREIRKRLRGYKV